MKKIRAEGPQLTMDVSERERALAKVAKKEFKEILKYLERALNIIYDLRDAIVKLSPSQDDLGGKYKGRLLRYRRKIAEIFNNLLERYKPARIIELGTGKGGLAVVLAMWCYNSSSKFITFDSNYTGIDVKARFFINTFKGHIFKGSIFSLVPYIKKLIQQDGKVLLLCDNGNKPKEIEIFAPLLKPNDIIMAHDYCTSKRVFNANKIYKGRSCEITYDDIKEIIEHENLILKRSEPIFMWVVMEKE